jgi:hypothetical protein
MKSRALLIEVTVYDDATGEVFSRHVETYTGSYGYEVTSMFDKIGAKFAPVADPYYAKESEHGKR